VAWSHLARRRSQLVAALTCPAMRWTWSNRLPEIRSRSIATCSALSPSTRPPALRRASRHQAAGPPSERADPRRGGGLGSCAASRRRRRLRSLSRRQAGNGLGLLGARLASRSSIENGSVRVAATSPFSFSVLPSIPPSAAAKSLHSAAEPILLSVTHRLGKAEVAEWRDPIYDFGAKSSTEWFLELGAPELSVTDW
jgi:hypothetical protein